MTRKWKYQNTERWEFIKAMPHGSHRLWREKGTERVSLADHSGDGKWVVPCGHDGNGNLTQYGVHEDNWYGNPSQTEDGPLFLDHNRMVKIDGHFVSVPVITEEGEEKHCSGTVGDAFYYAAELGMRLEVDGREYFVAGKELPFLAKALGGD